MNHILVLALVAFVTIDAASVKTHSNGVEASRADFLSKKIDQNIINHVIALLDQQTGSGDATNKHVDKATVLRKLLNRRVNLIEDVEAAKPKLDSKAELLMKKHENKIAQLKKQIELPEKLKKLDEFKLMRERIHGKSNFEMPSNVKIPEGFKAKVASKLARSANADKKIAKAFQKQELKRSFKVPEHIKLPEKFEGKL